MSLAMSKADTIVVYDPNAQFREWREPLTVEQINHKMQFEPKESEGPIKNIMIFRPTNPPYETPEDGFNDLAEMLWYWRDYAFIVDEASTVQTHAALNEKLERMLRQGPQDVHVIQATHRLVDLHRFSRAMSTDFFVFRTSEKKDIARLAEEFDARLPRILPNLSAYEVVHHWQGVGGVESTSVWRCPKDWFVQLGHGEKEQLAGATPEESEPKQKDLIEIPGLTREDEDLALLDIKRKK